MKRSARPSTSPFDATSSAPNFLGPITPPLVDQTPAFPKFPTVDQLLAHQEGTAPHPLLQLTATPPPSRPSSLFQGLLGGQLDVLVQDAADHPERYDDATRSALAALGAGNRELTPADHKLLDNATMDYAAFRPPKAPPRAPDAPKPPPRRPRLLDDGDMPDGREPQVETPGGVMSAYWWLS